MEILVAASTECRLFGVYRGMCCWFVFVDASNTSLDSVPFRLHLRDHNQQRAGTGTNATTTPWRLALDDCDDSGSFHGLVDLRVASVIITETRLIPNGVARSCISRRTTRRLCLCRVEQLDRISVWPSFGGRYGRRKYWEWNRLFHGKCLSYRPSNTGIVRASWSFCCIGCHTPITDSRSLASSRDQYGMSPNIDDIVFSGLSEWDREW
mmetsp:Transcript_3047/g.5518  ORF Transcript_3047/g.5518 Transcript_3047/m.5518 type:complete len:209 (+) Transcript_3047:240-866(+)